MCVISLFEIRWKWLAGHWPGAGRHGCPVTEAITEVTAHVLHLPLLSWKLVTVPAAPRCGKHWHQLSLDPNVSLKLGDQKRPQRGQGSGQGSSSAGQHLSGKHEFDSWLPYQQKGKRPQLWIIASFVHIINIFRLCVSGNHCTFTKELITGRENIHKCIFFPTSIF